MQEVTLEMTMTIRYQTTSQSLTQVDTVKNIPDDATIVWFDFEDASEEENNYLTNIILISIT